jgi:DNA-binding SARP family transcriptional activator
LAGRYREIGETLAPPRIYLAGELAIEHGSRLVRARDLPGRQGRLAFAYMVLSRDTSIDRDELAAALWGDDRPREVETAQNAILSKLRGALKRADMVGAVIEMRAGAVTLRLPADTHIDIEAAANAIDEAEGALRRTDLPAAWAAANITASVTRRPFLPQDEAPWIEYRRGKLRALRARALQVLATVSAQNSEPQVALQYATELVELDPFCETAYQQLMLMHAAAGNRAEAVRVFGRCRDFLRDQLGTCPSPQTEALLLQLLEG